MLELANSPEPGIDLLRLTAAGGSIALTTSGSSGTGARRVVRSAASWVDSFPHVAELCMLTAQAQVHIPGPRSASMNLYAAALAEAVGAAETVDVADATHVFCTPAVLAALVASGLPGAGRTVVTAGDRLTRAAADRAEGTGWRVHHYYGAVQLSFVAWGRDATDLKPFPLVDVDVRDGTIWVRSPWICLDELPPPGLPCALVRDGAWATVGDRGHLTPDGRLQVGGRDDVILCGGSTVYVADVEEALRPYAHGDLVVVGVPHSVLGSVPVAITTNRADRDRLPTHARSLLTGAGRPRRWLHRDHLPITAAGKTDRVGLAAWAARRRDPATADIAHSAGPYSIDTAVRGTREGEASSPPPPGLGA